MYHGLALMAKAFKTKLTHTNQQQENFIQNPRMADCSTRVFKVAVLNQARAVGMSYGNNGIKIGVTMQWIGVIFAEELHSGQLRINPFKAYREEKYVPNKVKASVTINPITVSQPHVITKKDVNSDSNGLSSTGVDNTAKTRRP
ncbi:hypothetical protein Tco_1091285 [Tanacetum coccineum]|uniref:Uncharacterized protein n=1 Tax=Tanacetum coccineum TaxID=301880 RepID=A0ABQ5I8Y9_9ASTR